MEDNNRFNTLDPSPIYIEGRNDGWNYAESTEGCPGVQPLMNPYPEGTSEHELWAEGYAVGYGGWFRSDARQEEYQDESCNCMPA